MLPTSPGGARPRRPGGARAALLAALLCSACWTTPPEAHEWLAVGFRTPEQTFASFQTALAGDAPDLEYRTLSRGFRSREGISQLAYREARAELLARQPWIRKLADAEILESTRLAPDLHELIAGVDTILADVRLRVVLDREDYWALYQSDGLLMDRGAADLEVYLRPQVNDDGRTWLNAVAPLPEGRVREDVSELQVGVAWKIDLIEELEAE